MEVDPRHKYFFLNKAFLKFGRKNFAQADREETRRNFSMLEGIILLDALGDLNDFQEEIDRMVDYTGLPIVDRLNPGLGGVKAVIREVLART